MSTSFTNPLPIPVLGFCAYSGMGKTTLLKKLIPELISRGLNLAIIKHAHHNFDVDTQGKDSYEMRKAGADQVLVASHIRWALMTEDKVEKDPELNHLLTKIDPNKADIVLVEGFKKMPIPKIELHRAAANKPFFYDNDDNILAVACCQDTQLPKETTRLDINNINQIADYVAEYIIHWQPTNFKLPISSVCAVQTASTQSVSEALNHILDDIDPIKTSVNAQLDELDNHVLASAVISPINVPQHNNSAMDGYAFTYNEQYDFYKIVGEVLAGHSYNKTLNAGEAVNIMTGAPIPAGADTVVPKEMAKESKDTSCVTFSGKIIKGQHVRLAGEDIKKEHIALNEGKRFTPASQGLLASLGISSAQVYRQPTVAVFSTGDEVNQPGESLANNCIFDSNRFTIKSMLKRLGCKIIDLGIIEDSQSALTQTLTYASQNADMIISSGGVSVGNADYIKTVLAEIGTINFWRINMRPGRPLAFGKIGKANFFGLPGNPVAVMIAMLQFVQPAIRKLSGEQSWQHSVIPAITDEKLTSRLGRTDFFRGIYEFKQDGKLHVRTTGTQGSGILSSMVKANCLVVISENTDSITPGETVYIQPFADLL